MGDAPGVEAFAGAVLAGGASKRMGADKATVLVEGIPMLSRVVATLERAGACPVVQVGGPARGPDLIVVADEVPGSGPLAGVQSALRWSPHPVIVVVACDLPHLTTEAVVALVGALGPGVAVAVADSGRVEPLCAAWRVSEVLAAVDDLLSVGERAVRAVFDRVHVASVAVDVRALRNVNRPDDLVDR
jgi:molybdenum cofactor guanylyltransferase